MTPISTGGGAPSAGPTPTDVRNRTAIHRIVSSNGVQPTRDRSKGSLKKYCGLASTYADAAPFCVLYAGNLAKGNQQAASPLVTGGRPSNGQQVASDRLCGAFFVPYTACLRRA